MYSHIGVPGPEIKAHTGSMVRDICFPTTRTNLSLGRCPVFSGVARGWRDRGLRLGFLRLLLIRDLSFEVHELGAFEALANGPLQDVTVSGYGDEVLGPALSQRVLLGHPIHLPHRTRVFV